MTTDSVNDKHCIEVAEHIQTGNHLLLSTAKFILKGWIETEVMDMIHTQSFNKPSKFYYCPPCSKLYQ